MAHFFQKSRHILNVLTEVDVSFLSAYRLMRQQPWPFKRIATWISWLKMFNYELDMCQKYDLILAVSQDEERLLRSYLPRLDISSAAPTGVDISFHQPRSQRAVRPNSLLFVGYFRHTPNVDGVLLLGRTIFPKLKHLCPDATLTIVGAHPPASVRDLALDPSIEVVGYVDDVRDYYRTHAVLAAPILTGAGTRVKILEAMAAGVPVVTTSIGAEGILCESGRDILISDDVDVFAQHIADLLNSESTAERIANAGRDLVTAQYDWDVIVSNLEHLYYHYLARKRGEDAKLAYATVG
jgi:glycosyltransferase involved in cell wall biosynthesis